MTAAIRGDGRAEVVILGGGFAGVYAAKALKDAPVRVTLVDRRNHHLFQPMLYQVATASLGSNEIASPIRAVLRGQPNVRVMLGEAVGIDTAARRVELSDGPPLAYDYLIVATGVRTGYYGHPEWEPLAPGLKTLLDALEIRRRVLLAFERAENEADPVRRRAWLTFVVVGAGPTGVEMAGALAELKDAVARDYQRADIRSARVMLLDAGPTILPSYPEPLVAITTRELQRMGVEIRTGARVEHLDALRVGGSDWSVDTHTVIWAAGVEAAGPVGSLDAPRDSAGRVLVEPDCTVPGVPEVFVIGDAGAYRHPRFGVLPCVCPVAIQQGHYVARAIAAEVTAGGAPTRRESFAESVEGRTAASDAGEAAGTEERPQFHYWNKGQLAVIGRGSAVCAVGKLRFSGVLAWLTWVVVHLFYLAGFRNRFVVTLDWTIFHLLGRHGARIMVDEPLPAGSYEPEPHVMEPSSAQGRPVSNPLAR